MKTTFNNKLLATLMFSTAIISCSATGKRQDLTVVETRTYISNQCLVTSNNSAMDKGIGAVVASTLIPVAVNWFIDQITESLTKVKKVQKVSTTEFYLYTYDKEDKYPKWNSDFKCITSITGVFEDEALESGLLDELDNTSSQVTLANIDTRDNEVHQRLKDNEIFVSEVYSIFESKLEFSKDASAFKFVSQYLDIKNLLTNKNSTELVYSYELVGPGSTPDSVVLASAAFNFGTVKPGLFYAPLKFKKGKESGWIRTVGMSKESLLSFISQHHLNAENKITHYSPIKLKASNIQTNKPSDGAKLVAAILGEAKETLSTAAVAKLVPEDKDEVAKKLLDAQIAYQTTKVAIVDASGESEDHQRLAELQARKACEALKELDPTPLCSHQ